MNELFAWIDRVSEVAVQFLLIESLYSALLFVPLAALIAIFGKKSPLLQYGLAILLFLRFILPPGWAAAFSLRSLVGGWPLSSPVERLLSAWTAAPAAGQSLWHEPFPEIMPTGSAGHVTTEMIVFSIWLGGMFILGGFFLRQRRRHRRQINRARPIDHPAIAASASRWRHLFHIRRPVRLVSSPAFLSPFTIGIRKPVIFLPQSILESGDTRLWETVIAHEMAHIQRHDDLWVRLQTAVLLIYFFHPVAWYANRTLNHARERLCDRRVLSRGAISPRQYAEGMLAVLRLNMNDAEPHTLRIAFSQHKKHLIQRFTEIHGDHIMRRPHVLGSLILLTFIALFLLPMATRTAAAGPNAPAPEAQHIATADETTFTVPIKSGRISSPFGERMHPIYKKKMMHQGIDIAAPRGTPLYAAADGTIQFSGERGKYGNLVIIEHNNEFTTRYAQLTSREVTVGQKVASGALIGTVGNSGFPGVDTHLHFELRQGEDPLNPQDYIDFDLPGKQ